MHSLKCSASAAPQFSTAKLCFEGDFAHHRSIKKIEDSVLKLESNRSLQIRNLSTSLVSLVPFLLMLDILVTVAEVGVKPAWEPQYQS